MPNGKKGHRKMGKSPVKATKKPNRKKTAADADVAIDGNDITDAAAADPSRSTADDMPEPGEPFEPEDVDDEYDEGFSMFKDTGDGDTWGDISRERVKHKTIPDKPAINNANETTEDRLRTKEQRVPRPNKNKAKKEAAEAQGEEDYKDEEEDLEEIITLKDDLGSSSAFHEMNLSRPLLKALAELNFSTPTPIQAAAIPIGLLGRDICACSRTGTGKTAAYMLPILERLHYKPKADVATRVLVLVPTRELGAQVYAVTKDLSKYLPEYIQVALAVGGLDMKKQEKELRELPDIVIATPGRLLDHIQNTPSFGLGQVEILVLDEADRMLDEFFAEQMNEVIKMCAITRQTMLFSATLTEEVQKLASISLKDPVKLMVDESGSTALALRQEFVRVREEDSREALLLSLLCRSFPERTLVFIPTKVQVHRLYAVLKVMGKKVAELHGNMSQPQRLAALDDFKESQADILLATDVAARGLDIPFVKTVINLALPKTLEQYVHRVGRTARAGRVGRAVSLVGEDERKILKIIVKNARVPVQNRIVPPDVVGSYVDRLTKLQDEVEAFLNNEKEDKAMARMAKDLKIVEDRLAGKVEPPPPKRTTLPGFSKTGKSKKWKKPVEPKKKGKVKKDGRDPEDIALSKVQKGQARHSKKDFRPQRTRACADVPVRNTPSHKKSKDAKKKKKNTSAFASDLADTRKKGVKRLIKVGGNRPNDKRSKKMKGKGKR
ncbi:hypothetical protein RvY_18375 [Ramazzottius varieornatus]|uniref:RNA helicase n=1 Tax=Ramazzottius varieornatus TaxID=947166 RepID=A0A1D1W5L0_RAMVA|nr:hypothetical protein RvY_18375 [Ramazzottius varieornatus]